MPKEKYPPKIPGAEETLRKTCMEKSPQHLRGDPLPEEIGQRLEKELSSIINNGYAVMYVSAQMLVKKSMEDGYLVGSKRLGRLVSGCHHGGDNRSKSLNPHYIACPESTLSGAIWNNMTADRHAAEKKCPVCGEEMNRDGFTIPLPHSWDSTVIRSRI